MPMRARDPGESHRVSTPLELLFDLCFVVAVAQAADRLHHALVPGNVAEAVVSYGSVFFAIWWAWMNFTWFASAYDTDDVAYRLLTLLQIGGVLLLAAGVPDGFDRQDFTIVTFGYVLMRVAMVTQWLRVAHDHPTSVMFPMVGTLDELAAARRMLADAIELVGRGTPDGLEVGTMVEVPAAALKARAFAPYVDFFSIGTNDLTQYAMAAERGNAAVADVGDPYDPGVLKLVEAVCRTGVPVAVCGELAADDRATGLLVGLGVRELSVTPRAVPAIKQRVRGLDSGQAATLAAAAAEADGADAVRHLVD